eukprot:8111764-Lingulodinium_polyedra.AAC.1
MSAWSAAARPPRATAQSGGSPRSGGSRAPRSTASRGCPGTCAPRWTASRTLASTPGAAPSRAAATTRR